MTLSFSSGLYHSTTSPHLTSARSLSSKTPHNGSDCIALLSPAKVNCTLCIYNAIIDAVLKNSDSLKRSNPPHRALSRHALETVYGSAVSLLSFRRPNMPSLQRSKYQSQCGSSPLQPCYFVLFLPSFQGEIYTPPCGPLLWGEGCGGWR